MRLLLLPHGPPILDSTPKARRDHRWPPSRDDAATSARTAATGRRLERRRARLHGLVPRPLVLTPNDFATLAALEHYLLAFQYRYQAIATPFRWIFTRADLHQLLARLAASTDTARPAGMRSQYVTVNCETLH